ncbi:hypothetical protein L3Q82_014189, partial [Scortum barcoo]
MESPVGALSSTLPGTPRRPGPLYCCSARMHKKQKETYPQWKRPSRSPGELQHMYMAAELGAMASKPTPAPPLNLGNSSVVEGPPPLKELGSRAQGMRGGQLRLISSLYFSTSLARSSDSFPPSEVTFHAPIARVLVQGLGRRRPLPRLLPKPHCTAPHGPSCKGEESAGGGLGICFGCPLDASLGEVFPGMACPTGRRPRGRRPRICWRDYASRLAWERLGSLRAGGSVWGEGSLGISAQTAASATRSRISGGRWMDGWTLRTIKNLSNVSKNLNSQHHILCTREL